MSWYEQAACRGSDPGPWFPQQEKQGGDRMRTAATARARAICARCPVRGECLATAVRDGERWGIWGGLSAYERRGLRGVA